MIVKPRPEEDFRLFFFFFYSPLSLRTFFTRAYFLQLALVGPIRFTGTRN